MNPGPLLFVAGLGLVAGLVVGPRLPRVWLALTVLASAASLAAALVILAGGPAWDWRGGLALGGEPLHFRLDALSAVFVALLSLAGGAGAVYAHGYWPQRTFPATAPRGRVWWSAIVLSQGVVLLAANGLHFLIGWELFAVSAYFLITLDRTRGDTRAAGWLYLAASHVSTLALFAFFGGLAARTGGWELGPMRDAVQLAPLFWLALVGFGLKAGMFPLHIWLPSAHASAPSHVSAMLSGVSLKLGVYGLVRFTGWLPVPASAPWVVIGLGAITAVLGIAFALAQNDLKRLLAYCSVENIGIILLGLGVALLAATPNAAPAALAASGWGQLALAGALLHVWNHGLFKSLLFYGAGSVLHATGTREMSRLGGLWRAMPWTAALFGLGAAAISGLPPFNGFVSEWLIYLGLIDATTGHHAAAAAAMPAILALGVAGALALATFVKASAIIFLGAPRTAAARHAHESGPWMRGPMLLLAACCLAIGLAPLAVWPALARAAALWHPAWANLPADNAPSPLAALTPVQCVLAVILLVGVFTLAAVVRRRGVRRGLTWDCGYAAPTARMQYTSGSFAGIGAGWFRWILRPQLRFGRVRGTLPALNPLRLERIPETVLELVLAPVGRVILQISTAVRRLQHGHLQYYIAYLLIGLSGLGVLVALGNLP